MKNRETAVQNSALLAVGKRQDVLAMRMHSGVFRSMDDPRQLVRVGVPGIADTFVVVAVTIAPEMIGKTVGIAAAAEIKTEDGRQSTAQRRWQQAFEMRGGIYRLVRSEKDMIGLVEDVKLGHW